MKLTSSQLDLLDALYEIGSFFPPEGDDVTTLLRAGLIRFKGGEEIKLTAEGVEALMADPERAEYWRKSEAEWMAGVAS